MLNRRTRGEGSENGSKIRLYCMDEKNGKIPRRPPEELGIPEGMVGGVGSNSGERKALSLGCRVQEELHSLRLYGNRQCTPLLASPESQLTAISLSLRNNTSLCQRRTAILSATFGHKSRNCWRLGLIGRIRRAPLKS